MSHARHFVRHRSDDAAQTRYGVLVGAVKDGVFDGGRAPHYEIWIAAGQQNYRVAVNVQSVDGSEVLVHFDPDYKANAPVLDLAGRAADPGFTELRTGPSGDGPDYLRDNLFDIADMQPVPDAGGPDSMDVLLGNQVAQAKADSGAVAIIYGTYFRDGGDDTRDKSFGFSPEQGVHDIHMMQGNSGSFERDNTTHGDGALFIRFSSGQTVALFTRFATQGTQTDDRGNPTEVDR